MPDAYRLLKQAVFLIGSPSYTGLPPDTGSEIAFAGRSNAGKSSVLNTLTGKRGLAKTSSSPGKTRHINLFSLDKTHRLADLPGYGYAKVPLKEQERWGRELTRYIHERQSLKGIIIVMDMRHPFTEKDRQMVAFALESGKPLHVVLNKADKLKSGQRAKIFKEAKRELKCLAPDAGCTPFSALKGEGIKELKLVLNDLLT